MKFKIGDKVKVINCDSAGTDCANFNKVSTITDIMNESKYPYSLKGITESFREKELELVERQFTKSDLQDGDIITLRNGVKYRKSGNTIQTSCAIISLENFTENLKDSTNSNEDIDIIKVERPVKYETVYERTEEEKKYILDKVEREYLKAVIKPFKENVKYIVKADCYRSKIYEAIEIGLENDDCMFFPNFEKGTMYKGMKLDKRYTLEELRL